MLHRWHDLHKHALRRHVAFRAFAGGLRGNQRLAVIDEETIAALCRAMKALERIGKCAYDGCASSGINGDVVSVHVRSIADSARESITISQILRFLLCPSFKLTHYHLFLRSTNRASVSRQWC